MDDMESKVHGAKKSSLLALHKMMKDLHHKSMGKLPEDDKSPHAAVVELDIEHSPISDSEHDEENDKEGVNPFDSRDMEDQDQAHEVEEPEAHLPEAHMEPSHLGTGEEEEHEEEENKGMDLPAGIHQMLMDHLKKKK